MGRISRVQSPQKTAMPKTKDESEYSDAKNGNFRNKFIMTMSQDFERVSNLTFIKFTDFLETANMTSEQKKLYKTMNRMILDIENLIEDYDEETPEWVQEYLEVWATELALIEKLQLEHIKTMTKRFKSLRLNMASVLWGDTAEEILEKKK